MARVDWLHRQSGPQFYDLGLRPLTMMVFLLLNFRIEMIFVMSFYDLGLPIVVSSCAGSVSRVSWTRRVGKILWIIDEDLTAALVEAGW